MSPKLFAIFVDEMITSVETLGWGIKIGSIQISAVMYADDLLLLGPYRIGLHKQLGTIEKYGSEHGIVFNPEKTELIIFNQKLKRERDERRRDEWQGNLSLGGIIIKQVNSIRYLGSYLSDNIRNKIHIDKKRSATYLALARLRDLGFDSTHTNCDVKGSLYKIYLRPILYYGIENCLLNNSELKTLKSIEGNTIKNLLLINKRCFTTEIMRSLDIELTEEWIEISKLKFYQRIQTNDFTKKLYDELEKLEVVDSFPEIINTLLDKVREKKLNNQSFNIDERIEIIIKSFKIFAKYECDNNKTISSLKKTYESTCYEKIRWAIEFLTLERSKFEFIEL